jgi:transketolase
VVIVLTRQKLPILDQTIYAPAEGLTRGAYVVSEANGGKPEAIIVATGSEVALALDAQMNLQEQNTPVRVVSMPSWEIFAEQPQSYRDDVLLPATTARVAVEAGSSLGWERWIGRDGAIIGIDRFGASAPGPLVLEKLGFTPENVAGQVRALL